MLLWYREVPSASRKPAPFLRVRRRTLLMPAVPPTSPLGHDHLTRRRVLRLGALAAATTCLSCSALAPQRASQPFEQPFERALSFYHVHTGERLRTVYWVQGDYLPDALREINYL